MISNSRRRPTRVAALLAAALLAAGCTSDDSSADKPSTSSDTEVPAGEVIGTGTDYSASIRRTTDGVPHISADSLADAAFGQGYASGEDRTCDLADQIVKIRGERASHFGRGAEDRHLNSDIAWRTIGIFERASQDWEQAAPETREVIEAFAVGWNLHLDTVGADGIGGWCRGQDWVEPVEPVEIYAYARSVALNASGSRLARYIATAQPPAGDAPQGSGASVATDTPAAGETPAGGEAAAAPEPEADLASNAWAIGSQRSTGGGGMLLANPHFPWEGELRFWEVHLTIEDEIDIYGAQLSGLPGIGIGFNENFGWTHTVSAGNRFTAYSLDLVEGTPTSYRYGDEVRDMTPTTHSIVVTEPDGTTETVEHTSWSTHYGPVIDFPGFGWTDAATISYRDANIDNATFLDQYMAFTTATDLEQFQKVNEQYNATPLFNTIAVSADGTAWYADTSATPNLSAEALAAYETTLAEDPIVKVAADSGAVLLDGSDPANEWVDVEGARSPGLVPYSKQPMVERDDYVFNANDSFWSSHVTELLSGDYSILHGRQETPRSPRTRENAALVGDGSAEGPAGDDGTFPLDELADAALSNTGYTSRALRAEVVQRCDGVAGVAAACEVLADWDGRYDLDSVGAALWREFISQYDNASLRNGTNLWAVPFDAARPFDTPSGLAPAPAGAADPVIEHLAEAVRRLDAAGFAVDVPLGDAQFALRNGKRLAIHGGTNKDGTINIVSAASGFSIVDPALESFADREPVAEGSDLATGAEGTGYFVNYGNSFMLALEYTADGPVAKAFLAYSNTEDRTSPDYTAATRRFADKDWRDVAFRESDVATTTTRTYTVKG